ncbi:MAG: hypothetical protein ACK481_05815 [Candidatus Melainabacteria bacterium]
MPNSFGGRACNGNHNFYIQDTNKNLVLFYEYFHEETRRGVGTTRLDRRTNS